MQNYNPKIKSLDPQSIKGDFPIFESKSELCYLDSTATSLKPRIVIDAINEYYRNYSANVFRGIYKISEEATAKYEAARKKMADFINAQSRDEIIFVRSATEAINLVAYAWGEQNIKENDEIVVTIMEHHSNFVPWQQLAEEKGAILRVVDIDDQGYLFSLGASKGRTLPTGRVRPLSRKTKLLALTHVSNVLGTINPIKEIVKEVKRANPNCLVLVDGAQAVPHMKVDVQDLGCDFYVFSSHKMFGPTGIGVLWGNYELLTMMSPFNLGGEMIQEVYIEKTTFKKPPHKFEAGTPHIAGAIGLGAALDYLGSLGMDAIRSHEIKLTEYTLNQFNNLDYATVYGPNETLKKGGVIAFNLFTKSGKLIHGHDVAQILDKEHICIRSGHHCAMPLHKRLGVVATARASFSIYNTIEDVDKLMGGLERVRDVFS